MERLAYSFGLSLAVVTLLGLLLNFTDWGIRLAPTIATIALFTIGVGSAAYWRRVRLPSDQRLSGTLDLELPGWKGHSLPDGILTILLIASITIAVVAVAYLVFTPRPAEHFTEFYILGPGRNASGYPTVLNVSQNGSVILGIVNHETVTESYFVRVDLVGVRIVFNTSLGLNQTVELNRTTRTWWNSNSPMTASSSSMQSALATTARTESSR